MSNNYDTIQLDFDGEIARLTLNRPAVHNAFNDVLIAEVRKAIAQVRESTARVLVISGKGRSFCAGADMNWLKDIKEASYEENFEDCYRLSQMFDEIYRLPIPTVAQINGAAVGGGVGIVVVSDIVVASSTAIFSLSEARIGLIPACIASYLIAKVGSSATRYYFLTGQRLSATDAKKIGLVHEICVPENLDRQVESLCKNILQCGPRALQMAKKLVDETPAMPHLDFMKYSAEMIAQMRCSEEGQEGLNSFLEKRPPNWRKDV